MQEQRYHISGIAVPICWNGGATSAGIFIYKVEKSRVSEDDSFGLGLSMVKWIAESHGGQIVLESHLGKGSSFTVIL